MPTQEERLAAVEQDLARFKTETINRYQDFAMQFTVTKALAENTIGRLAMMHEEMNQRFTSVSQQLGEQGSRLDQVETLLTKHTNRFDRVENLLNQILARLPENPS